MSGSPLPTGDLPAPSVPHEILPYAPSHVDRLMNAVKRLPVPYWVTYLGVAALMGLVGHLLAWADGWLTPPRFYPGLLLFPIWLCGPLALMTHLNGVSLAALGSFRPLLEIEERDLTRLKYELVTMAVRPVLLGGLSWAALFVVLFFPAGGAWGQSVGASTRFVMIILLNGTVTYLIGSAIYYHSLRQLRLVHRIVGGVKDFDLFRLEPVYAFSRLTARTGIGWIALFGFTLLAFPVELTSPFVLALYVMQGMLAIAAFFLPLQVVHQRLVAGKRRLLADLDRRLKAMLNAVHTAIDGQELGQMDQFESTLAVLNAEREVLNKLPTWPWRADTVRGFISAILLPILLLLAQMALERFLR